MSYSTFLHLLEYIYTDRISHLEGFSSNDSTNTANTNTSNNNNNNNGIRINNIKSPSQSTTSLSNPKASIPSLQTLCTTVVWKNIESYDFEALLMEDSNINYNRNRSGSEVKENYNNWMQWLISSLIDSKNHKLLQRSDEVINKSE